VRVLVIGDSCQDIFVYGDISRICPEGPVPVFNREWEKGNDGMALNVVSNLISLDAEVQYITNKELIEKKRYVDKRSNQLVLRVDENDYCKRVEKDILYKVRNNDYDGFKFDALVIADYNKGFLQEHDIAYLCQNNTNVFIDTKKPIDDYMLECSYIKINELEYKAIQDNRSGRWYDEKLIVTLGEDGCQHNGELYSTIRVTGGDVSGAGDTFMAALVVEYCNSNKIKRAIKYALKAATAVVKKSGVSTIELEEIR
jgi:D-beta-D-heptose 7-phosphate kinase/D-beta-D-heptose 1-phosphate adenosyltransferase